VFRDSLGLVRGHLLGKKSVMFSAIWQVLDLTSEPLRCLRALFSRGLDKLEFGVMLHGMFVRCRPVTENLTRETSAIARYGARLTSFILFLARTLGNPLYGRDDLRIREVFVPLPT
jgi:hypothetical protein